MLLLCEFWGIKEINESNNNNNNMHAINHQMKHLQIPAPPSFCHNKCPAVLLHINSVKYGK